jgi:NhaP-type Na+/H+ or K+/H+ antiporter
MAEARRMWGCRLTAACARDQRSFFRNFGLINSLAILGTLISTFIVGYGLYALQLAGVIYAGPTPLDPLLFGSLISAIDPVGTLALFSSLQVRAPEHTPTSAPSIRPSQLTYRQTFRQ